MSDDIETVERHLTSAHDVKGEHQLAQYVTNLDLDQCAQILTAVPGGLLFLTLFRSDGRSW